LEIGVSTCLCGKTTLKNGSLNSCILDDFRYLKICDFAKGTGDKRTWKIYLFLVQIILYGLAMMEVA